MTLDELIRELYKLEDRGFGSHEVFFEDPTGEAADFPIEEVTIETPDNRTETAYVRIA